MRTRFRQDRSLAAWPAVLFLASMATFMQSFVTLKLSFLALFLFAALVEVVQGDRVAVYPRLVVFYLTICVVGIVWAFVGLLSPGNHVLGVTDAVRLYVVWSLAYLVIFSLLRSRRSLRLLHVSMVLAGLLIAVINFVALYDQVNGLGLISEGVRNELNLNISIYPGYIQVTSKNIGPLFLVLPYLLTLQFRSDAGPLNSWLTKLSTVLCLVLAALSGRRALWLVAGLTPWIILLLSYLTRSQELLRANAKRFVLLYSVAAALVLLLAPALRTSIQELVSFERLSSAFSAQDERSIQKGFLIQGFAESPVLGSGFGANAGYTRSGERPWTYELTYHQMLFNLGLVGVVALGGLFGLYLFHVGRLLRGFKEGSVIPFGLLVGFCTLMIGVYSNPYLSSFDLLFFVGVLPYLSTFSQGFDGTSLQSDAGGGGRR